MRLSIGAKVFFLVVACLTLAVLLPILWPEIFPKMHPDRGQFAEMNVQSIDILCHGSGRKIFLYSTSDGGWLCNFDGVEVPANYHAIVELLSTLGALKFHGGRGDNFPNESLDWMVILTDGAGNESKVRVAGDKISIGRGNSTSFLEDQRVVKCLEKIYPELYCKTLLQSVDTVSGLKFSAENFSLYFVKVGDFFRMVVPINRPMNGKIVDLLSEISSLHCDGIGRGMSSRSSLFTLEFDWGRRKEAVEFYGDGSKFYAEKGGVMHKFSGEASDVVRSIYSKFLNFRIFFGLECHSMDIFSLPGNRQLSFQKLENGGKWQKLQAVEGAVTFTDVDGDEIRFIESKIANFGPPVAFDAESHAPYVGGISLKSNIGELNFDILESPRGHILFNRESSLAFAADGKFIEILHSLFGDTH